MTDKLFDSFVKQKLKNFESEVPKGLWDKIMPEEDKKPKFIWWWNKTALCIAIALTTAIAITSVIINDKNNGAVASANESTSKLPIAKQEMQKKGTLNTSFNNTSDNNTIQNIKAENQMSGDKTTQSVTANGLSSEKINKNTASKNEVKNGAEANSFQVNKKTAKLNTIGITKGINKNKLQVNSSTTSILSGHHSNPKTKEQSAKSDIAENNTLTPIRFNNNDLILSENTGFDLAKTTNKNLNINIGNLFGKTEDCPTAKGSSRNDFYIEFYASPDYTFKKVINATSGLEQYLIKKDSVEVLRGGFTVGARISKSITNNLLLKAGFQYSQVNEEFRLKTENERRQTIIINTHTINRPGLGDTTISDTSYSIQIGYRVQKSMNYYRNLELPILLSYEFGDVQNKWKYALNAGAIINLTSWYEGRTLDANYNMVSISSKNSNTFYKQQLGCSLYGGISIMRKLNDNVDVFAEPYFRISLNKIESVEGFSQKFNAIGLQIGARIQLNSNKHY